MDGRNIESQKDFGDYDTNLAPDFDDEFQTLTKAAAAEAFPEHMGALSVGTDHGYGKVEDVREQHAKELQREKKNDKAEAAAAAAKAKAGESGAAAVAFVGSVHTVVCASQLPPPFHERLRVSRFGP